MKLHIFNPEHDIALAANQERVTMVMILFPLPVSSALLLTCFLGF